MKTRENLSGGPNDKDSHSLANVFYTWRYLFFLLGLAGLILLFYGEENWRGYHSWQKYKEQMAARGEPTEPETFIPPPVPDEENFAMTPSLAPLFEFVPGTQHWRDPKAPGVFQSLNATYDAAAGRVKPPPSTRLNSWVRPTTDLDAWAGAFAEGTNRNPRAREPVVATSFSSQDAAAAVLQSLADFSPVLDELRSASRRPYARFNIRYDEENPASILIPHLAKIKYLCQVLQLRVSAELALGRTEAARADLTLMFYLMDTSRTEPILISQMVRMSEFQMALQPLAEGMGKWSEPQLRALQERLQAFDFLTDIRHTLQAERTLFGDGIIEYVRRSSSKLRLIDQLEGFENGSGSGELWPVGPLLAAAPGGWLYLEQLHLNRLFDQYLLPVIDVTNRLIRPEAVRESDAAVAETTRGASAARFLHHQFFSSLLLPAISRVFEKAAFAQTAVDTASLACALERYRLAHGQFPDSLEKLAPQFIAKLPLDLINRKPLTYHLMPDGHYFLYSVGWNGKDDDGSVQQTKGGSIDQHEGDWVWADRF